MSKKVRINLKGINNVGLIEITNPTYAECPAKIKNLRRGYKKLGGFSPYYITPKMQEKIDKSPVYAQRCLKNSIHIYNLNLQKINDELIESLKCHIGNMKPVNLIYSKLNTEKHELNKIIAAIPGAIKTHGTRSPQVRQLQKEKKETEEKIRQYNAYIEIIKSQDGAGIVIADAIKLRISEGVKEAKKLFCFYNSVHESIIETLRAADIKIKKQFDEIKSKEKPVETTLNAPLDKKYWKKQIKIKIRSDSLQRQSDQLNEIMSIDQKINFKENAIRKSFIRSVIADQNISLAMDIFQVPLSANNDFEEFEKNMQDPQREVS